MILFTVSLVLFQSCAEDLSLPATDVGPVWETVDVGCAAGRIYVMTKGPNGEIVVGAEGRNESDSRVEVFISRDGGESWQGSGRGFNPNGGITALACAGDGLIYAGFERGGVFLSKDGGENWVQMNNLLTDIDITDLAIAPSGDILASTSRGVIFRSRDNASSWAVCDTLLSNDIYDLFVSAAGAVYAACGWEIFVSLDSGSTWAEVEHGVENSGHITALIEDAGGAIYASTDNGIIMKSGGAGIPWGVCFSDSLRRQMAGLATDGDGRIFGAFVQVGLVLSPDGGANWTAIKSPGRNSIVESVMISGGSLLVGGEGLFRSIDQGENWNTLGWEDLRIRCMDTDNAGFLYLATDIGIMKSVGSGTGWIPITCDQYRYGYGWFGRLAIHPLGYLYYLGYGIHISENRDGEWTMIDSTAGVDAYAIDFDEAGTTFATTSAGIFRSQDGLAPFEMVEDKITNAELILAAGEGFVFACGQFGMYASKDNGSSWEHVIEGTGVLSADIDEAGNLYAATGQGMMISQDTCATWTTVKVGYGSDFPWRVIVLPDSRIMAVTYGGKVYLSPAGGTEWEAGGTGTMQISPGYLYLSADGCLYYYGTGLQRLCAGEMGKL
jgi:photosystem II stability/assembly factor-like uncharacterized protein